MVGDSNSKTQNGNAPGSPGLVSKMVRSAGDTGVDMITDLSSQIIVKRVIPAEWELSTIFK